MLPKLDEKKLALKLRSKGLSYSEILNDLDVSQASLSLWLRDVKLTSKQKLRLEQKKRHGQLKGAEIRRIEKLKKIKQITKEAKRDIKKIKQDDLFLIGVALYWGEGFKQTPNSKTEGVKLANTDPRMIKIFLVWLNKCLGVKICPNNIKLTLHLHQGAPENKIKNHWKKYLGLPEEYFGNTFYKKIKFDPQRRKNYLGVLRVKVRKSTDLNRKIAAWTQQIYDLTLRGGVKVARSPLKREI